MKCKALFFILGALAQVSVLMASPLKPEYNVKPLFGYLPDGKPGRIVGLTVKNGGRGADIEVETSYKKDAQHFRHKAGARDTVATFEVMLPASVPTDRKSTATVKVKCNGESSSMKIPVTPMRHWTVYLFNHAHVDIGYTNTHKNVEKLHTSNVVEGMALGRETAHYPHGSRYVWNPEVTWPVERLLHSQPEW